MNAPNVRSVTVRLNADVAAYMAKIKAAGKATDTAFDRASVSVDRVDRNLQSATKSADTMVQQTRTLERDTVRLGTSMDRTGNAIDRTSGRIALFAKLGASIGPALGPLGAVGIAGVAGVASQLGFAAAGITSLVVASQGLGDALKAVETARLEPTVDNLEAARDATRQLGPDAQAFVYRLQELRPVFADIRDQAAAGWFPGLSEALGHFEEVAPRVGRIFKAIGEAGGELVADAAESLAGPEWAEFLTFIKQEAPGALEDLGRTAGNLVHGMAELWMAFSPANNDFSDWLLDMSRSFDDWSTNLSKTDGFRDFVDYLRTTGPKVAAAAGAVADALIQIVEAAAPLGGPVLDAITGIAKAIGAIANSPLGAPLVGVISLMSTASLATAGYKKALEGLGFQAGVTSAALDRLGKIGSLVALAAILPQIEEGVEKIFGKSYDIANTSDLGRDLSTLLNTDEAVGEIENLDKWLSILDDNLAQATSSGFEWVPFGDTTLKQAEDSLKTLDDELAVMVESGRGDEAAAIFEKIRQRADELGTSADQLPQIFTEYQQALDNTAGATGSAAGSTDAYARANNRAAREQLRSARAAKQLREAMKEQREAVAEMAGQWSDYSQKVQLGKTSVEQLMNRWEKLGQASADMAENIQSAIGRGLDPEIVQDVIETLGPQGAALALEQFANATGQRAKDIEADFRLMSSGAADFADAWDLTLSLVNGTPLTLGRDIIFELDMAKAAFDSLPKDVRTEIRTEGIPQTEAEVNALVDKYKLTEREREALITLLDQASPTIQAILGLLALVKDKHVTVTTTYIRELITKKSTIPQSPPGGGNPLTDPVGADGMTVPGQRLPYGDKVLIHAAPGEEVITNRHGEADRFRRDRAAGRIPAYAEGGTVGAQPLVLTRGRDDEVTKQVREETEHRKRLNAQLKEATKVVEKERRQRDALVDRMDQIRSGLVGGIRSDLGAGTGSDPWAGQAAGGTLQGNLAIIRGDTAEARRVRRFVRVLREQGFDGAALEDLLSRGDVNEIASFAGGSRRELASYERAFRERQQVLTVASRQGADAALGGRLDTANDELRQANRRLDRVEQAVKQASNRNSNDHQGDRDSQRRGAGNGRRNSRRDAP